MGHLAIFIVNQNGSLVYHKVITPSLKFATNDTIRLASTFHSMHAISQQITPNCQDIRAGFGGSPGFLAGTVMEGINEIVTDNFTLKCFQSFTGVKFILVSDPQQKDMDYCLKSIYEAYADHVSKNPFQEAEMPIRSDLFEGSITKIFNL
ncbi:hypothetical protein FGO68_gene14290 [Halteria grandinella]|uniref:Trafficking protein particle complex subunit n=1 Tax=Halteria grandinella TaxID=5974 RepID=A0A8J8NJ54_HALGN|nr:hypothetical protein FGO68_gene14290 [Halteria grandinella]